MRKVCLIQAAIATLGTYFVNAAAEQQKDIAFNVIHTPNYNQLDQPNKVAVRIEGTHEIYVLDNSKTLDRLVHTGTAPSNNKTYQYVILDQNNQIIDFEPFYRHPSNTAKFEFYGHSNFDTVKQSTLVPTVRYTYKDDTYEYKEGLDRTQVHPIDDIPTFHIQSNPSDFNTLHENVLQDIGIDANVTRICKSKIERFNHVKIELSGQTSRLFKKLSYSVNIGKESKALNGYRRFKLRSCATDPSYLREKLYYDMLYAAKVPTAKASFIRLFINEEPQGLYLLVDHYKNPFLKNVFGGGNDKKYKHGALYQGSMQENPLAAGKLKKGANLGYLGPSISDYIEPRVNASAYKVQESGHGVKPNEELQDLVSFINFIHETDSNNGKKKRDEKDLAQDWNKKFDVSLFLKHMAFEILMGHNDGYMGAAHNYMLYQDPDQKGRFIWFASDLDQTLGSTLIAPRSTPANSTLQKLDRFGLLDNLDSRPLINQLLQIKQFKQQFYQILTDLHESLFKSNAINNHMMYLKNLIEQDVAWDKQIDPLRIDNFKSNQTIYDNMLNQKVLQLPLGPDFMNRMDQINFTTAIEGDIEDHPSITSLVSWFNETDQFLDEFVKSLTK